jgi:hypothetical protein
MDSVHKKTLVFIWITHESQCLCMSQAICAIDTYMCIPDHHSQSLYCVQFNNTYPHNWYNIETHPDKHNIQQSLTISSTVTRNKSNDIILTSSIFIWDTLHHVLLITCKCKISVHITLTYSNFRGTENHPSQFMLHSMSNGNINSCNSVGYFHTKIQTYLDIFDLYKTNYNNINTSTAIEHKSSL